MVSVVFAAVFVNVVIIVNSAMCNSVALLRNLVPITKKTLSVFCPVKNLSMFAAMMLRRRIAGSQI